MLCRYAQQKELFMRYIKYMLIGGCMSLLLAASTVLAATPAADVPLVVRLQNGLTVLVLEDSRFPLVSTRLYVHAGSSYEKPDEAGISHVLEHMVFKGTEKRPKGAVAREVEAAGGYLNAATSFDYTVYLTDMPARHWKLGMDVVRDMAFHPTLDPAELESEKEVVVAELKRGKDNPQSLIFEELLRQSFAGTPYGHPIIGFEKTIRGLTVEMIRKYIDTFYQPQSMLLVVVGDVKAAEVVAEAEAQFGAYPNRGEVVEQPLIDVESLRHADKTVQVERGQWNKVYLSLALPVPGTNDVRAAKLDMLAHLMGGDQTSLFWRRYKYDLRLVDSIQVSNLSLERVGLFYITAEMDAANVEPFWKALTADLAKLSAESFTVADLDRAKLNLEDDLFRAKETLSGLASKLGFYQFFTGNGVMGEQNALNLLRAMDRLQLQQAIDTWLKPGRLSALVLAPEKAELPDAESLASMLRANWPAPAEKAEKAALAESGKTETVDLGQGRTLVLIPDRTLPYVSADLAFHGGNSLIKPDQQGLAALAARVLTKGTAKRGATAMQDWLADRASGLAASAGSLSFTVSLSSPSRYSADLFTMLNEVLREPAFSPEEVEREKQSQAAAIRSRDDQPLGLMFRRLPTFLFPGSIFGYYQLGLDKDVLAYTPEDVRTFWNSQKAQPWVLSVAGEFDREAVIAAAKALPAPSAKATDVAAPHWTTDKSLALTLPGRNQAHYLLLFKTVPMDHPDAPALDLLQNILAGQSGLLFRDLRDDKGLGYTVTAMNSNGSKFGYLAFYIGTEPDKLKDSEAGFARVLDSLHKDLLPEAEIQRGKSQMEGDYYRERQSLGSRAGEAASLTLLGKPLNFQREHIDKAAKVTAEKLREIARTYLQPDKAYTITVLP